MRERHFRAYCALSDYCNCALSDYCAVNLLPFLASSPLRQDQAPPFAEGIHGLDALKASLRQARIQRVVQAVVEESEADGLPEGWPDDWPRVKADPPIIDKPDRSTRWDGPRDASRRTEQRRAIVKVQQHEAGEAALKALLASVPPPPTWPPPLRHRQTLLASAAYRGPRGVRVLPVEGVVLTASGERIPVTFNERGMPVRVATTEPGRLAVVQPDAAADQLGAFTAALRAIERSASRKPPDVHVHVAAPDLSSIPAPVVHVNVAAPPPRAVRVEVDAEGIKHYIPE
jgi:hypothetical protein